MIHKEWTVLELIRWGTQYFGDKEVDSPRLTMELLLADVMNLSRVQLYTNFDKPLTANELSQLRTLVKRRARREPLQYILGTVNFYGLELEVTPAVLIPRPETEELVDEVLRYVRAHRQRSQQCCERHIKKQLENDAGQQNSAQKAHQLTIMDVGTGSGCIALALASALPESYVIAVDVSAEALAVACRNAQRLKIDNIRFVQADILHTGIKEVVQLECVCRSARQTVESVCMQAKSVGLDSHTEELPTPNSCCVVDVLVSNPPYISIDQMVGLQPEVALFEPRQALTDGSDGLTFYRHLARWSSSVRLLTAVEIGYGQQRDVEQLFAECGRTTVVKHDTAGVPRILLAPAQDKRL